MVMEMESMHRPFSSLLLHVAYSVEDTIPRELSATSFCLLD